METTTANTIEKQIKLNAPMQQVWEALADSRRFGTWFGLTFEQSFEPGRAIIGKQTDPANLGRPLSFKVVAMEAPSRFAYRWRPHAMDQPLDDERETTLVEFVLEADGTGTSLLVRESGFEAVPEHQRESNFRENDAGWDHQTGKLADYLTDVMDQIRKEVTIKAPIERVWRAVSDAREFGTWFGLDTNGQAFEAGRTINAKITEPPEYAGMPFVMIVQEVVAPRLFSFRWHPYAVEESPDYAAEPTTLVEFVLEPEGSGTRLTITESGFDSIPEERRASAFRSNEEGWSIQAEQVRIYAER